MKIACFTPLQPVISGISDYNEDLIPYLIKAGARMDFFYEEQTPVNDFILKNCGCFLHTEFPRMEKSGQYDLTVYHIGNHLVHNYMYNYLFDFPGMIVLHDFVLHHSRLAKYVLSGDLRGYINEMETDGREKIGRIIAAGMGGEFLYYLFPLNRKVVSSSILVVMHNSYLLNRLAEGFPEKTFIHIPHNAGHRNVERQKIRQLRAGLSIPEDALVVATFGFMNEAKKISLIARALKRLMQKYKNIYYLICGEDREGIIRSAYFNLPGISKRIKVSGYIEGMDSFMEYIESSDIVINLRFPSAGETSGTMIRSMAQGKTVITYDLPTLLDIPDDALARIPLTDDFKNLVNLLEELITNEKKRKAIGNAACRYVETELNCERNAALYIDAFEKAIAMKSCGHPGR